MGDTLLIYSYPEAAHCRVMVAGFGHASKGRGSGETGLMKDMLGMMMAMMEGEGQIKGKGKGKGGGGWVDESGGHLGEYTGTIKSFAEKTGYGFIDSPDIRAGGYPADVFLLGGQKKGYRVGHVVKFTAVLNKDGKPVAKDLRSGLKEATVLKPDTALDSVLGEFKGQIKSFADNNGYGFIDCPEIKAMGYQDVYLHGNQKKGYKVGQMVKFTGVINKVGKPEAKDLKSGVKG